MTRTHAEELARLAEVDLLRIATALDAYKISSKHARRNVRAFHKSQTEQHGLEAGTALTLRMVASVASASGTGEAKCAV